MSERQATKYGKLIGRIDDNYYFLDEIFKYGDNFEGATATATVLRPISAGEWEDRNTEEAVEDEYRDHWQVAVSNGETELGLTDWIRYVDALPYVDDSGSQYHDDLREATNMSVEDYPEIECVGDGRSFKKGMAWDYIYNQELLDEIEKVEK